jgi:hypothetical protein
VVAPDAWFVYEIDAAVLVGLVEVDLGTERGELRWNDKLAAYQFLFQSDRLPKITGYQNARVLVFVPNDHRRDNLAALIAKNAPQALVDRFWIATREHGEFRLDAPVWKRVANPSLSPLVESVISARSWPEQGKEAAHE